MPLDPSIALGVRPIEMPNQLAQYGQMQQILAAQDAQQMNALKMQEARATMDERNMLRRLDPTAPDYESQLFRVSPQLGINYRKEASAAAASKAQQLSHEATTAETKQKILAQALRDISQRPDNENIISYARDIQASPLFSKEEKANALALQEKLFAIPFDERGTYLASQGAKSSELKPTTQVVNRSGSSDVVQVPAFGGKPTTVGTYADTPFPKDVEAQKARIALAGRPPAQPRAEQPPVAVVDPVTGKPVYVTREQSMGMTPASAMESLPPKEIQRRESVLPQARQSVKTVSNTMSVIGKKVDDLLANEKGIDGITGLIYGNTLAITPSARKALADVEQLKNLAFIQGITELRAASKTGAAVGNVSNKEGDRFENLKASLNRSQSKEDFINGLKTLKQQSELTSQFMRESFDETYSYKSNGGADPAAVAPAAAAPAANSIRDQADAILRGGKK